MTSPLSNLSVTDQVVSDGDMLCPCKTVQGDELTVTVDNGKVKVDSANVIKTDIVADNGVIHVIDTVLMPK